MFSIPQLFNAVFATGIGFNIPKPPSVSDYQNMIGGFTIPEEKQNEPIGNYAIPEVEGNTSIAAFESMGGQSVKTKYGQDGFYPIWLGGEKMKYFDAAGKLKYKEFEKLLLPLAVLVDQDTGKEIVKTPINGGQGTVKELYALNDWNFRVRGLLIDEGKAGRSAIELKHKLIALQQFADSIPVEGLLFDELEVDRVVLNNISFRQLEGKPWVIGFDMQLESDYSLELVIQSGNELRRV